MYNVKKQFKTRKNDITLQHTDILAICSNEILSFVVYAVLDLRVGRCRP